MCKFFYVLETQHHYLVWLTRYLITILRFFSAVKKKENLGIFRLFLRSRKSAVDLSLSDARQLCVWTEGHCRVVSVVELSLSLRYLNFLCEIRLFENSSCESKRYYGKFLHFS